MDREMMVEVFQKAFTEITMKLTKIPLKGSDKESCDDCKEQMILFINGYIDAEIVCFFATELYQAIVKAMHGGTLPVEEDRILYLKEYVNIVCGRALSVLNNEIGTPSRLSVPYYRDEAPMYRKVRQQEIRFFYETDFGAMQVRVGFSA